MRFLITIIVVLLIAPPARAQPSVDYRVVLDAPQTQTVTIHATFRGVDSDTIEVHLPTWRPGRYVILDPAGTVRDVADTDAAGIDLPITKPAKSTWRIETLGSPVVNVSYRLYANSIGDRTRHVDDSHAFLSGSSVFMYVDELRDAPIRVTIEAPDDWQVATGLEPEADDPRILIAPSYDRLVDSPIEVGLQQRFWFEVDNIPHEIVIWGRADADSEQLKDDFAKIVRAQADIFGHMPYERYVFLIHSGTGLGGGTEHWNSTIMQTRPKSFTEDDAYEGFLGLVSHEMFHTWNVKRLRPAGITPYNYLAENYTDLLWVAEGTTSYYDDLTLARVELISVDDYLDAIADNYNGYLGRPGKAVQSLEESSHDAWIKFNKRTPDSVNSTVSFYRKGALVSMMLDMRLRAHTDGRYTLDALMRDMYEMFHVEHGGFTTADLRAMIEEKAGMPTDEFFDMYVAGVADLDMESALAVVGLELTRDSDDVEPYLGLDLTGSGVPTVRAVRSDGPAYAAGVIQGDEIVAVDGIRVRSADDLDDVLEQLEPGDSVRLSAYRRDVERSFKIELGAKPKDEWEIHRVDEPTDQQRAQYEDWLGLAWTDDDGDDDDDDDEDDR